ncbi:uncharacterized protein LOC131321889 [Rhododendron vialii]|uniref:uncharacterized protein LOC131321889 n=1 Tax=Rhododendron vialii TaxID=182163 RepID=UPI00265EB7A9|nr:uncharacterized protein LOC131321889 [Rhododendron vialii]
MAPIRALKNHKRSKNTTTEKVGANVVRCGRWVLRQTKIRKARGQIFSPKTPPRQVPSKVSVEKKKHSSYPLPSEESCTGENSIPVARMADDLSDIGMWGYSTVETFINIMLDEVKKEGQTSSKKDRNFTARQWTSIEGEMTVRLRRRGYTAKKLQGKFARLKKAYKAFVALKVKQTGLGWDEATGTVTMSDTDWQLYLQAHPDAKPFRTKGLEHYDLLAELLGNTMATGAYAPDSTVGPITTDDEDEMEALMHRMRKGKGLQGDTSSGSKGKRKSDDGQSCGRSHPSKMVRKEHAYEQIAFCQKAKGEWYQTVKIQNTEQVDPKSEPSAIEILNSFKPFVEPTQFLKAFNRLAENLQLRKSFVQLDPDMRRFWVETLE